MKSGCHESLDYPDALREYRACIGNLSRTAIDQQALRIPAFGKKKRS
jgi:hypothetical protein